MVCDHLRVDAAVGGEDAAEVRPERLTGCAGHAASGFGDDQRSGRDIPRLKLLLPEPVEPSGGDVTEVEGRASEPADRSGPGNELTEQREQLFGLLVDAVMKAGDQKRVDEASLRWRLEAACRSATPRGLVAP